MVRIEFARGFRVRVFFKILLVLNNPLTFVDLLLPVRQLPIRCSFMPAAAQRPQGLWSPSPEPSLSPDVAGKLSCVSRSTRSR